ncbi:hypothetical protein, partial [Providencia rettgeri]|uniref:hypothetical protein n=2 Tax=Morganellaceae TaxID=1903414 RepID=UPI0024495426
RDRYPKIIDNKEHYNYSILTNGINELNAYKEYYLPKAMLLVDEMYKLVDISYELDTMESIEELKKRVENDELSFHNIKLDTKVNNYIDLINPKFYPNTFNQSLSIPKDKLCDLHNTINSLESQLTNEFNNGIKIKNDFLNTIYYNNRDNYNMERKHIFAGRKGKLIPQEGSLLIEQINVFKHQKENIALMHREDEIIHNHRSFSIDAQQSFYQS